MTRANELDTAVEKFASHLLPSERPQFYRLVKALQAESFAAGIDQASTNLLANLESDENVSREFSAVMRAQSRRLLQEFDAGDEFARARILAKGTDLDVGTPEQA